MPGKDLVPAPAPGLPVAAPVPPWERKQPKSEAGMRVMARFLHRNRHVTVPLAIPFALWPAAAILHEFRAAGFVLLAGVIATAFVVYFTPHKWGRRSEQWYARASAFALSAWLWLAVWLGPVRGFVTGIVLASTLLAGAIAWGVPWWHHKRPRGRRKRDRLIAKWDEWWQFHCWHWNLGGSRVIDVKEMGVTIKVRIQGLPGRHSIQYVNQVMHLIESSVEGLADIGRIRSEPVKGNPSQFDLFFKKENPLRHVVEYDLAMAPRSVHEPAPLGLAETGAWRLASLRKNSFVIGATRTGKSNHLLVRLAALTGCADDRQVVIDLKGGRSARPVLAAAAAEYVITELDEARMYLRMLVAEIHARAKYAYPGEEEQLRATAEIPALHTLIDETHGLTSVTNGDAECARLLALAASQGTGLEVYEEVYTQYGSLEESVRTEQTRGNLALRVVYRVEEARHGAYVIPEYNKLDASKLEEQGTCYVKDGPEASAEQVRAPKMAHTLFKQIATQNARLLHGRPPLQLYCGGDIAYYDGETPVTWQQWWDTRWLRLDRAFHGISPQYQDAAARYQAPAAVQPQQAAPATQPPEAIPSSPGEGDGASVAARIRAETAATPPGFKPMKVKLGPIIASQKETFAGLLGTAPAEGISPKQLEAGSGMGSSWVYQILGDLQERGAVTKLGRGRYAGVPGRDIGDAIAAIEAGYDQLHREARKTLARAGAA